ncbi:MAG: hypothetical protein MAG715_00971 [Methanonatronarchaeales archaeon]|nr:hypothetical protein [Methanonatronarchaeales archaeon]
MPARLSIRAARWYSVRALGNAFVGVTVGCEG